MIDRSLRPRRVQWLAETAAQTTLLAEAAQHLRDGQVVGLPTDTVYGLAALPACDTALDRLYALKERPREKAIALLVAGPADLERLAANPPPAAHALANRFWPGGLTLVLRSVTDPTTTVGLRMPDHAAALRLIAALNSPLATTSANRSSGTSPRNADDVLEQLPTGYPLLIDAGPCPGGVDSTVVDLTRTPPRILRGGAVSREAIEAIIGPVET
jgi:L-threonylcarbamoyladenylate synthase